VVSVSVDGATNAPTTPDSADGEVLLDIEVAGAIVPKANIIVYFTPNTDQGFYNAIMAVINDTHYAPKIISISWGGPENQWAYPSIQAMNSAFKLAYAKGISVFVAAGDNGFTDGEGGRIAHVDFPGTCPFVTCCGGTYIQTSGGKITSETVWNDDSLQSATGGGISDVFWVPWYQATTKIPVSINPGHRHGRAIPDVSGCGDPQSGYNVLVDGEWQVVGGTSAVAPLWAALIARVNSLLGRNLGFLNPLIYPPADHKFFNDITQGNNGGYSAGPGYDCCTGWGSPNGSGVVHLGK
jgi:kumamolisin